MKIPIIVLFLLISFSCRQQEEQTDKQLKNQIEHLEDRETQAYHPGFGEIMSSIQIHHSKLWFSGIHKNWELAAFEIHEMTEATQDIQKYQKDRKESELMNMIEPVLDSLSISIKSKNSEAFLNYFKLLTQTCNDCHQATKYNFIRIKTPDKPAFDNQQFDINP